MPGVFGVTVVTNARVYYSTRAAAGASSARHSLCPLLERAERSRQNSRESRGEIADLHSDVIASQRVARIRATRWLAMTVLREGSIYPLPARGKREQTTSGLFEN